MRFLTVALLAFVTSSSSLLAQEHTQPPNIVFVLIDDMGWSDLGCYGNTYHETPAIDALASQGMKFTDFYAAGAVCSPTRASIQSGQYQARLGITDFIPGHRRPYAPLTVPPVTGQLPLNVQTPAEMLSSAGYQTAYFGKWHLGGDGFGPQDQGYQTTVETNGGHFFPKLRTNPEVEVEDGTYLADFLTSQTIDFMKKNKDGPFFVMLSHFAVHIPLQAKEDLISKYEAKPKPDIGVNNPVYAAMVEHVDQSVGRIIQALDQLRLERNTVLIVTSDNGGLYQSASRGGPIVCSNAPLRDEKGSLYEGGIRVPLIVRWLGEVPAGTTCDEPAISIDFWPTFAEIAGVTSRPKQPLDGVSLLPVLKDPDGSLDREAIFFHYPHYHHSRPAGAIRRGDMKLIEFFEDKRLELYDLSHDISEEKNLLEGDANSRHERQAQQMQAELASWRQRVDAKMPEPNPNHDPKRELEIVRNNRRRR